MLERVDQFLRTARDLFHQFLSFEFEENESEEASEGEDSD